MHKKDANRYRWCFANAMLPTAIAGASPMHEMPMRGIPIQNMLTDLDGGQTYNQKKVKTRSKSNHKTIRPKKTYFES